ncbi:MAG: hypothetical protein ACI9T8_000363 [Candidatus Saccharimonadales bacterium]|jgi:hypothetical protein
MLMDNENSTDLITPTKSANTGSDLVVKPEPPIAVAEFSDVKPDEKPLSRDESFQSGSENNNFIAQDIVGPIPSTDSLSDTSEQIVPPSSHDKHPKVKKFSIKKLLALFFVLLLFVASLGVAYFIGKSNGEVVETVEELKLLNLPPQAVVVEECVENRGKQYILPKDIPEGPIYDVVNGEVIAVEYNLNIAQLQSDPDSLSNTILLLAREYPVDHFSFAPVAGKEGQGLENVHLVMFVVTKEEAKAITCE